MRCRYCERELEDDDGTLRCGDHAACSGRVAQRLGRTLKQNPLTSKRYVGFDPDKAYKETMKRQGGRA